MTGSVASGHTASLTFQNLQEPAVKSILDHFYGQRDSAELYFAVCYLGGLTEYTAGVVADQKWRYSEQPNITAVSPGIMTVSVQLVALA